MKTLLRDLASILREHTIIVNQQNIVILSHKGHAERGMSSVVLPLSKFSPMQTSWSQLFLKCIRNNHRDMDSRRIFIVMLHLYGTREDTKIWGENNFRACEEVQHAEVSVAEGRREGQKGHL